MFTKNLVALALCVLPVFVFSAPSPLVSVEKAAEPIPGKYIVLLKEGASRQASIDSISAASSITQWDVINGFAGSLSPDEVEALRSNPDVLSIEEDGVVHTQAIATQSNAPWGLGRISSIAKVFNNPGGLTFRYDYDSNAGRGATVYVIDTGIFIAHPAFGGRARWGATFGPYANRDGNGHGTHCAGTAVSGPYGVAKKANVVAVKVLSDSGSGTITDVISGINWVATHHAGSPAVASMSFAAGISPSLDAAVTNLIRSGVTSVIAAGNANANAINTSPARVQLGITVGASTILDAKASFSNYGPVVDVWAPGLNIISTWNDGSTRVDSGTSMATPHVSGVAAYFLGTDSSLTPAIIQSIIKLLALKGVLTGIPAGTPNLLLHNGV